MSLQWTLYLLAKNAEAQEKVAAAVCNGTDVMQSALLRGVVREALRLYPVAPFLTRIIPESCIIGGYELPAMVWKCCCKTYILVPVPVNGMDD